VCVCVCVRVSGVFLRTAGRESALTDWQVRMLRSIARTARLVKRTSGPAALFGAGYACHWSQCQDESAPQLLAFVTASSYTGLVGALRCFRHSLPGGMEQVAKVEAAELRCLSRLVDQCSERGLDSVLLRQVAIRRCCACAEDDARGPPVLGLVPTTGEDAGTTDTEGGGSGLPELVHFIDTSVAIADLAGDAVKQDLLQPLVAGLQAIITTSGDAWHKELGCEGVARVARSTVIASHWLAESLRARSLAPPASGSGVRAEVPAGPETRIAEDEQAVIEGLSALWQALGESGAVAFVRSMPKSCRTPEAMKLHGDFEARVARFQVGLSPPPKAAMRPPQDFLPQKVRARMLATMRGIVATPKAAVAGRPTTPTASVTDPTASGSSAGPTRRLEKVGKLMEYVAWTVLVSSVVLAISDDGFGSFGFHIVPMALRSPFKAFVQSRAAHVEDLLSEHEPLLEASGPHESFVVLGPTGIQSGPDTPTFLGVQ